MKLKLTLGDYSTELDIPKHKWVEVRNWFYGLEYNEDYLRYCRCNPPILNEGCNICTNCNKPLPCDLNTNNNVSI